jgi:hypothetical protein
MCNSQTRQDETESQSFAEPILDFICNIRKEARSYHALQAFQFVHCLSGGMGSGSATFLLDKLREDNFDPIPSVYSSMKSISNFD